MGWTCFGPYATSSFFYLQSSSGSVLVILVSLPASAVVTDRVYFETLPFSVFVLFLFFFDLLLLSYTFVGAITLPCNDLLFRPSCCTS